MAQDEYVSWPGTGIHPGTDAAYPGWGKIAPGSTSVHSPRGSVWEEVTGNEALQAAGALANAARRAGQSGPVDLSRISPDRPLSEDAAKAIAQQVGRFLTVSTHQLVVSGSAAMQEAVIQEVWSRIITAKDGVFDKIRANNLSAGIIDGQIITGATIRTAASGRRVQLDSSGIRLEDSGGTTSFSVNSHTGQVYLRGNIGTSDDWSSTFFKDVKDFARTSDWERWGGKAASGIMWQRNTNPWAAPGFITCGEGHAGNPYITIQAPGDRLEDKHFWISRIGWEHNGRGTYSRVDSGMIKLIAEGRGRLYLDEHRAKFVNEFLDVGLEFESNKAFFGQWNAGEGLHIKVASWSLTPLHGVGKGCWMTANDRVITMWHNRDKNASVGPNGFFANGGKNFIMRVPRLSKLRGGKYLRHASTESPWDGIEYWDNITVGENGTASWVVPDYVPAIASARAPRSVFATADRGAVNAWLDDSGSEWRVRVKGEPGARVAVLLKLGRVLEGDQPEGEPIEDKATGWTDDADERMWVDPPELPEDWGKPRDERDSDE